MLEGYGEVGKGRLKGICETCVKIYISNLKVQNINVYNLIMNLLCDTGKNEFACLKDPFQERKP